MSGGRSMKQIKWMATALTFLIVSTVTLSACDSHEVVTEFATELSHYDGTYREELDDEDKPQYNRELWRRAELTIDGADPMILDDTANSGYYYAYSTGFTYYYSENMQDWYYGGSFVTLPSLLSGADMFWAPEVIYDEQEERYFSFFTMNPPAAIGR